MRAPQLAVARAAGGFLGGAGCGLLALARLHALPASWLLLGALLLGTLCALPWALLALLRRSTAHEHPLEAAASGLATAALTLALPSLLAHLALRRLAVAGSLLAQESWLASGWRPLLLAALAIGLAWGLRRLARIAAQRGLAAWPVVGVLAVLLPIAALLAGRAAEEQPDATAAAMEPGPQEPPSTLIVGIDAIGVEAFERFGASMPTLSAFAEQAARGVLVPEPPYLSPAIWTSIATGLPADEHGVSNYELYSDHPALGTLAIDRFYTDPATALLILPAVLAWRAQWLAVLPSTRLHRQGEPFWERAEGTLGVACWPATWPAAPIDGVLVSDRWPPDRTETLFHYRSDLPHQTWPPELEQILAQLRRDPSESPDPQLVSLAPMLEPEVLAFHDALRDDLGTPKGQPFSNLHYAWLNDRSCLAAARWILEAQRPRHAVVYLMGSDLAGHAFLPDEDCRVPGFDDQESARLCPLYERYLARLDQDLAWLLQAAGPDTTTFLISDHGLQIQGTGLFSIWHEGDGLFLAQGPGYHAGQDLGTRPAHGWYELLLEAVGEE